MKASPKNASEAPMQSIPILPDGFGKCTQPHDNGRPSAVVTAETGTQSFSIPGKRHRPRKPDAAFRHASSLRQAVTSFFRLALRPLFLPFLVGGRFETTEPFGKPT